MYYVVLMYESTTITVEQLNDYLRCKLTLPLNLSSSILGNSTDEYVAAAPNCVCYNPHNLNKQLLQVTATTLQLGFPFHFTLCSFEYFSLDHLYNLISTKGLSQQFQQKCCTFSNFIALCSILLTYVLAYKIMLRNIMPQNWQPYTTSAAAWHFSGLKQRRNRRDCFRQGSHSHHHHHPYG